MNLATQVTITVGLTTVVGFLWRIAWTTGKLVQRFDDHVTLCDKIHADQETRIRWIEQLRKGQRR